MKKILYITPHLSTGGLPAYLLRKIELMYDVYDVYCVEYQNFSPDFIVQKSAIQKLLRNKFFTLGDNKKELLNIIKRIQPDIIHIEELPETFINIDIIKEIYSNERDYVLIETTHSADYTSEKKMFMPDKFSFVSQLNYDRFLNLDVDKTIIEYELDKKQRPDRTSILKQLKLNPEHTHILNVGLFTPGKNQGEIFELAKYFDNTVKFHFVGNQAGNFQDYWAPLMKNKPANCIIHGERNDVDKFYSSMDMLLFTSKYENNPLVIKEALAWNMKVVMRDLPAYKHKYDNEPLVTYLNDNVKENIQLIKDVLSSKETRIMDNNMDTMSMLKETQSEINKEIERFIDVQKKEDELVKSIENTINPDIIKRTFQLGAKNNESKYPTSAFITHTTENYLNTTKGLIQSLLEFSENPIVLFTVNFDTDIYKNNNRVFTVRYNTERNIKDPKFIQQDGNEYIDRSDDSIYNILTLKPFIILKAFELGINEGIYLDGDMVARYNVDDLFENINHIKNYPLVTRGVFSILLGPGAEYYIERHLMEYLDVKTRGEDYVQTNTIAFNKNCKAFIEEWRDTCDDDYIRSFWRKLAPYHEETIINVLFWKYGYTDKIELSFFNVKNIEFIKAFEDFDDSDKSKFSKQMNGFRFVLNGQNEDWSWIPYNKSSVKTFHGLKNYNEIVDSINFLITRNPKMYFPVKIDTKQKEVKEKKNHICVVMQYNESYKEIGDITSEVNKKYCEKHGYDFQCINTMIDSNMSVYWQKPLAIKKFIEDYDWVFYIDSDSMFMNHNIKIESIIDENYNLIMPATIYCPDFNNPEYSKFIDPNRLVTASHILIKNTPLSIQLLDDVIQNKRIPVTTEYFDYDNRAFRILTTNVPHYKTMTKIVEETLMNSVWPMYLPHVLNEAPSWNNNTNIYKQGNFTVHVVGYPFEDRKKILKELVNFVNF
jgi:hypothetical protein